jgi:hypothetical protein
LTEQNAKEELDRKRERPSKKEKDPKQIGHITKFNETMRCRVDSKIGLNKPNILVLNKFKTAMKKQGRSGHDGQSTPEFNSI